MRKTKVAAAINEFLKENGIKQEFLCNKINIAQNTLSDILNGKRRLLADEFVDIAIALGVDVNYFVEKVNNSKLEE